MQFISSRSISINSNWRDVYLVKNTDGNFYLVGPNIAVKFIGSQAKVEDATNFFLWLSEVELNYRIFNKGE